MPASVTTSQKSAQQQTLADSRDLFNKIARLALNVAGDLMFNNATEHYSGPVVDALVARNEMVAAIKVAADKISDAIVAVDALKPTDNATVETLGPLLDASLLRQDNIWSFRERGEREWDIYRNCVLCEKSVMEWRIGGKHGEEFWIKKAPDVWLMWEGGNFVAKATPAWE